MSTPEDSACEGTIAEAGIRRTLARYCQTCDDGRFDEFASCFTDDAVMTALGNDVRGRRAIQEWMTAAMPPQRRGRHVTVNSVIEVSGDAATATSDFLFVAKTGGELRISTAGRYRDELRRVGAEWLFARREIELLAR